MLPLTTLFSHALDESHAARILKQHCRTIVFNNCWFCGVPTLKRNFFYYLKMLNDDNIQRTSICFILARSNKHKSERDTWPTWIAPTYVGPGLYLCLLRCPISIPRQNAACPILCRSVGPRPHAILLKCYWSGHSMKICWSLLLMLIIFYKSCALMKIAYIEPL